MKPELKIELRPELAAFATHMEQVLRNNDHKGGWEHLNLCALSLYVEKELHELNAAIHRFHKDCNPDNVEGLLHAIQLEACDLANYAMMLHDNVNKILNPPFECCGRNPHAPNCAEAPGN